MLYPSEVWCRISCIGEGNDCTLITTCPYRKEYLKVFSNKQRNSIKRHRNYSNGDGYIPMSDIVEMSRKYLTDGFRCEYCGTTMMIGGSRYDTIANRCTLDHRIPLSAGGTNSVENMLLCCHECNSNKGGKTDGNNRHGSENAKSSGQRNPCNT